MIKINRNIGNNRFEFSNSDCIDHPIPTNDKTIGIANSDLHIYVTAFTDGCKKFNNIYFKSISFRYTG